VKVQIFLEAGIPPDQLTRLGALAEGYGIHTLWASSFPARRDPFLCLSALAHSSSRMRLGVVPVSPYEIHPVKLTDSLYTLNDMCGGRASLLVGGMGQSVMRITGLQPTRRVRAVRECVEIIRGASAERPLDYEGEIYRARGYSPDWISGPRPVVYVGATGPAMLHMTGQVADGVMFSDVPLSRMGEVLGHLDSGLAVAGRRREEFRVNNFFAWHIKEDRRAALEEARMELVWRGILQQWYTEPFLGEDDSRFVEGKWPAFLQAFLQRNPVIDGVPDDIVDALVENLCFAGGLEEVDRVIGHLQAFSAAGLNEITLKVHGDAAAAIRIIGERIVPEIQAGRSL